jgi:hypothetical protein
MNAWNVKETCSSESFDGLLRSGESLKRNRLAGFGPSSMSDDVDAETSPKTLERRRRVSVPWHRRSCISVMKLYVFVADDFDPKPISGPTYHLYRPHRSGGNLRTKNHTIKNHIVLMISSGLALRAV